MRYVLQVLESTSPNYSSSVDSTDIRDCKTEPFIIQSFTVKLGREGERKGVSTPCPLSFQWMPSSPVPRNPTRGAILCRAIEILLLWRIGNNQFRTHDKCRHASSFPLSNKWRPKRDRERETKRCSSSLLFGYLHQSNHRFIVKLYPVNCSQMSSIINFREICRITTFMVQPVLVRGGQSIK